MPISKNIKPKKELGQNFLNDDNISKKIVEAINIEDGDNLIEIGPGTAALTKHLYNYNINYHGIEVDPRSAELLKNDFVERKKKKFIIINQDFKKVDIEEIYNDSNVKIFGNLPYYLTSPIIFKVLESSHKFNSAIFMVQKEVAQRITAKQGSKENGILGILCDLKSDAKKLFDVSPNCFYPKPKVWSSVIKLEFNKEIQTQEFNQIKRIVKKSFNQRRKMISNTLKEEIINSGVTENDYFKMRPEQLSSVDFIKLNKILIND